MKILLLSPNIDVLLTSEQMNQLKNVGELLIFKEIKPFSEIKELFTDDEKIIAIDPDFSNWSFPNEIIDKISNLKAIILQTTSFSWIDIKYAKEKGIPVINLRGFSSIAVAEWATMMTLMIARKLPIIMKDDWKQDYDMHKGIELRGKTAGIIGLGNIGTTLAENMQGLGMKVQYWSKHTQDERFKYIELEKLMKTSDVIIPAVAQNEDTNGLITDDMLKSMKNTAIFISNIHAVYNHELLLKLTAEEKIFGYGFEEANQDIKKYSGNVWPSPELAWCTTDSLRKNAQLWVEAIMSASMNDYPNQVNK